MTGKNTGRDRIHGDIGEGNRNTVIGTGVTQTDDSRDINQYFGTPIGTRTNEDLAEILNIALFGNDKLDFKGVISEVSALKNEIKNLITQVDTLQNLSKQREQSITDMKSYILNLEKDISDLKYSKRSDGFLYLFVIISTISSISTFIILLVN